MGTKLIFGVSGGMFNGEMREPEAMMFSNRPTPTKLWKTPTEKSENPLIGRNGKHDMYSGNLRGMGRSFTSFKWNQHGMNQPIRLQKQKYLWSKITLKKKLTLCLKKTI